MIIKKNILKEAIEQEKFNLTDNLKLTLPANQLNYLFSKFGISNNSIVSNEIAEDDQSMTFQTPQNDEEITITIPKSQISEFARDIIEFTKKLGEDIIGIRDWYLDAHNFIVKQLGSDAPFFLMLLGVTSKSRSVTMNLATAKAFYYRFKEDLKNNREEVINFVHSNNNKFGSSSKLADLEYNNLTFLELTQQMSGLLPDFKNINKILKLYFANNENITFDVAIDWMKSFFNIEAIEKKGKRTLDTANSISGHKLFNYTMNLLDPMNLKTPNYYFVTIDRHMIKYFMPQAAEAAKSESILAKVFSDTNGMYYALSLLIRDITTEVNKTFPDLQPNQVQAIVWFIARERYSDAADNEEGGTYEKEFNKISHMVHDDLNMIDGTKGELTFNDISKYTSNNFNKTLKVGQFRKNALNQDSEEAPF